MKKAFLVVILYAAALVVAVAADDPPELAARRKEHLRAMQRMAVPLLESYVRTLEVLKAQFTREGKLDQALAVESELKSAKQELDVAQNVVKGTVVPGQITIISAKFGDEKTQRLLDVTELLQKKLASGDPTMRLSKDEITPGQDPAPFVVKTITITYTINGKRKQKIFTDGDVVNFYSDLR